MEKHQFHRRHAVSRWSKLVWILEASGFGDPNLKILLKRDQQKLNMQILDPKNRDLEHDLFSFSQKGRLDVFVGSSSGWFSNVFFLGSGSKTLEQHMQQQNIQTSMSSATGVQWLSGVSFCHMMIVCYCGKYKPLRTPQGPSKWKGLNLI